MDDHEEEQGSGEFEFLGRRPHITINGGIGGVGGGGIFGGTGGRGDGPQFHIPNAPGWNVHVHGNFLSRANAPYSDYRRIPMGDIVLQSELHMDESMYRLGQHGVRKLYSAALDGKAKKYIVAMYEGEGSEAEWKRDVARYMSIRHLHILQIFAIAQFRTINAAIFHNESDLIDFEDFAAICAHESPMLFVCIFASAITAFHSVHQYLEPHKLSSKGSWLIHRSTGRFCIDISGADWDGPWDDIDKLPEREVASLGDDLLSLPPILQQQVISKTLSFGNYYLICHYGRLYVDGHHCYDVNIKQEVHLAVVSFCLRNLCVPAQANHLMTALPLAFVSNLNPHFYRRDIFIWPGSGGPRNYANNGWSRIPSTEAKGRFCHVISVATEYVWFSQANHLFKRAGITSKFENYDLITSVEFTIQMPEDDRTIPEGYLWICPAEKFQLGPVSFHWPESPVFWSLDSSGSQRLDMDQALQLGFPELEFSTTVWAQSWPGNIYAALREFHEAKGFDPHSPQVAMYLGAPLFQLCSEAAESPFAHIDSANSANSGSDTASHSDQSVQLTPFAVSEMDDAQPMDVDPPADESFDVSM
ncbi:hypothetical protein R3P38DRAFT_1707264 [Favolaschia claudopus]|uniref:Uncharacterized protein n=1 Tax=Favolaschia claudopus TaxID=2862362 RepID=A0AAW0AC12_9AGAR